MDCSYIRNPSTNITSTSITTTTTKSTTTTTTRTTMVVIPFLLRKLFLLPLLLSFHTLEVVATGTATTTSVENLYKSEQWVSLQEGLEFQSASATSHNNDHDNDKNKNNDIDNNNNHNNNQRKLNAGDTQDGFQSLFEADGLNTKYNTYATAWRYLGFYIDCSSSSSNNSNNNKRDRERDLGGGGNDKNNNYGCARYLLWAAVRTSQVYYLDEFRDPMYNLDHNPDLTPYFHFGFHTFHLKCHYHPNVTLLYFSMLMWTTKEVALENINFTIASPINGMTHPVPTVAMTDVPRWIVTWKTLISSCWDTLNPVPTINMNGSDNFSNMKESVCGTIMMNIHSCRK